MSYTPNNTGFYDGQLGYYDGQPGYYGATSSEGALRDNAMANNTQQPPWMLPRDQNTYYQPDYDGVTSSEGTLQNNPTNNTQQPPLMLTSNQPPLAPQGPERLFPGTYHSEYTEAPRPRLHYPCRSCPMKFETPDLREIHVRTHLGLQDLIICEHCGQVFVSEKHLNVHVEHRVCQQDFTCEHCGEVFKQRQSHRKHVRDRVCHGPEERKSIQVTCEHCDEFFASKENYNKHIRNRICREAEERKAIEVACEHCSAVFSSKSSLCNHIRKRICQRAFICEHCSEVFKQKQSRDKHVADGICPREVLPPLYGCPVETCPMVFDTSEENQEHHWNTHVSSGS